MEVKGKGSVVMDCVLKDGSVSSFQIYNVLYVPDLVRPLFSWRKIKDRKGFKLIAEGDLFTVFKFEKVVFEATFDGMLFKIPETSDSAFNTFDFWHQALGHLSASSIEKARKFYDDAQIIPKKPDNFHCEPYTTSKLTHSPQYSSNK